MGRKDTMKMLRISLKAVRELAKELGIRITTPEEIQSVVEEYMSRPTRGEYKRLQRDASRYENQVTTITNLEHAVSELLGELKDRAFEFDRLENESGIEAKMVAIFPRVKGVFYGAQTRRACDLTYKYDGEIIYRLAENLSHTLLRINPNRVDEIIIAGFSPEYLEYQINYSSPIFPLSKKHKVTVISRGKIQVPKTINLVSSYITSSPELLFKYLDISNDEMIEELTVLGMVAENVPVSEVSDEVRKEVQSVVYASMFYPSTDVLKKWGNKLAVGGLKGLMGDRELYEGIRSRADIYRMFERGGYKIR